MLPPQQPDPRTNPIHGEDLAEIVVEAIGDPSWHDQARAVGGPDILSMREIVELAFEVLDKRPRIRRVPPWAVGMLAALVRPLNRTAAGFLKFFVHAMTHDVVGEAHGTHHVREFFEGLVAAGEPSD